MKAGFKELGLPISNAILEGGDPENSPGGRQSRTGS